MPISQKLSRLSLFNLHQQNQHTEIYEMLYVRFASTDKNTLLEKSLLSGLSFLNNKQCMLEEEDGSNKKIFYKKPHVTVDNIFSGDKICDWTGSNGFECTITCRRY